MTPIVGFSVLTTVLVMAPLEPAALVSLVPALAVAGFAGEALRSSIAYRFGPNRLALHTGLVALPLGIGLLAAVAALGSGEGAGSVARSFAWGQALLLFAVGLGSGVWLPLQGALALLVVGVLGGGGHGALCAAVALIGTLAVHGAHHHAAAGVVGSPWPGLVRALREVVLVGVPVFALLSFVADPVLAGAHLADGRIIESEPISEEQRLLTRAVAFVALLGSVAVLVAVARSLGGSGGGGEGVAVQVQEQGVESLDQSVVPPLSVPRLDGARGSVVTTYLGLLSWLARRDVVRLPHETLEEFEARSRLLLGPLHALFGRARYGEEEISAQEAEAAVREAVLVRSSLGD